MPEHADVGMSSERSAGRVSPGFKPKANAPARDGRFPVTHVPGFAILSVTVTASLLSVRLLVAVLINTFPSAAVYECPGSAASETPALRFGAMHHQGNGTTTCTWFEYELSTPVESTAVVA